MGTIIEKIKELKLDEVLVLNTIEHDADLLEIFRSEIGMPFNILYVLQKDKQLNDATIELIHIIFNEIILTKKELINKYLRLAADNGIDVSISDSEPLEVIEVVEPVKSVKADKLDSIKKAKEADVVVPIIKTSKKETKKAGLPRRYGKDKILPDIQNQNGVATAAQRAALANNDLKNLYMSLERQLIKTMLSTNGLTEDQCAEIEMAIIMLKRKVDSVLKPKTKAKPKTKK